MITWAILWFTVAMHKQRIKTDPQMLVFFAMVCDVLMAYFIAGAFTK